MEADLAVAGFRPPAAEAARPIDDVRGSALHRRAMVRVLVARGLAEAAARETP